MDRCKDCGEVSCTTKPVGHWDGKCSIDADGNVGTCHGHNFRQFKPYEQSFAENHPDGTCELDALHVRVLPKEKNQ